MALKDVKPDYRSNGNISRRELLKQSVAFAMLRSALTPLHASAAGGRSGKILAYVGTYSAAVDGGGSNGKGIYLFEMDITSGELSRIKLAAEARNASWLSLDPSGRHLYAVNEVADFDGNSGSVSAFAVNRANGELQLLNVVSSEGAGPAHLSVDASGKFVFVANYAGGTLAVLPILSTGALGPATDVHQDTGSLGPKIPASAAAGFSFSGHDKPHAHMIHADPGNRFVLQSDLGQDRIYVYRLDPAAGKLSPVNDPFVALPPGDGPRHFTFHRN